ncbi:MAG: hypothetical protein EOP43_03830, partial [Sphingobacteriaceae bacterium]
MENENFDADLTNRIKLIFEDYDDGQANEGWNLLREKYPEKNNRKYFFWWISAAVLLFTFLMFWFFQPKTDYVKSVKNTKSINSDSVKMQVKIDSSSKKSISKTAPENAIFVKKLLIKTASKFTFKRNTVQQKKSTIISKNTENEEIDKYNNTVFIDIKLDSVNHKKNQTQALSLMKTDSANQKNTQPIDSAKNQIIQSNTKKEVIKTASVKKLKQKVSRFGWSLYVGPHANFAKTSNTMLGFGAGISADFTLNKKLKLATGLGLLQNRLSYQNKVNNNFYALLPANSATNPSGNTIVNNTTLNGLDVNLLQLDVPVNLVYQILPGKNSIAILAGLSSGTFVKEN